MRLSAALAFALIALPAAAADSIADQASAAYSIFAAGKSQPDFLVSGTGSVVLSDIAGTWVSLNGPAPGTGVETYGTDTAKFCQTAGVLTLASPDVLTMTLSAKPGTTAFSQTYTLVAGTTYSQYTEPGPYFAAIGLGLEKTGAQFDQSRALALELANGIVQLFRPSDDILVIARDKAYPTILARCPRS
jgi:hypothetical protein